jgi:hypothetical protein
VDLIELGSVLADFFDQGMNSPSHDEIGKAFARQGLTDGDPKPLDGNAGKVKRVREVMIHAADMDPAAGLRLATQLVSLLRGDGAFRPHATTYAGADKIEALRDAFRGLGYDLDSSGAVRPIVVDNLSGTALTDALSSYIRRANLNPDDTPLQVGNGKELDEAAARHVLNEVAGGYSPGANFPVTLAQAFMTLGLEVAPPEIARLLDADPRNAVHQCLYQLGCSINRLRNEVGTGHGHAAHSAVATPLTAAEGRLVTRATALLAGLLLDTMDPPPSHP